MIQEHLTEDQIVALSAGDAEVDDRAAAEAHLTQCAACAARLEEYRQLHDALSSVHTWAAAEEMRRPLSPREQALALSRTMREEDAAAARLLRRPLTSPDRLREADLLNDRRARQPGVIRLLNETGHATHERQPKFSALMTATAYDLSRLLPETGTTGRRLAMAQSLREHANALRYLGRFTDALQMLDRAEKLFDEEPGGNPFDIACVQLIRSTVLMKMDRLDEAKTIADAAARDFLTYNDQERAAAAEMVRASCLLLSGEHRAAAVGYERVALLATAVEDDLLRARALHNAALAYTECNELTRAERNLLDAIALFDEAGLQTEGARASWALATVAVRRGDLEEAVAMLSSSRIELARLGLTNDVALATLEWAEAGLAIGHDAAMVRAACEAIVVRFDDEGMQAHARRALAYLHEAMAKDDAAVDVAVIREVRLYLEALPSAPDRPFAAS